MLTLTIIGVLASCFALAIQVKDSFKESSKLRDKIIFSVYGFMLGIIVTATTKVTVTFGEELFFKHIVTYTIVVFLCVSLLLILVAILFSKDNDQREIYFIAIFVALLFLGLIYMTQVKPGGSIFDDSKKQTNHTSGEFIALADYAADLEMQRAELNYLINAKNSLDPGDPRYSSVKERVEILQSEILQGQLGGKVEIVEPGGGINSEAAPLRDTP